MRHPFVPLVLLVLAPLAYFELRLGLLRLRAGRLALGACTLLVLGASCLAGEMDFVVLGRIKMALAAAAALLVALRGLGVAGLQDRRRYRAALGLTAAVSWVVYFNFFSFHGSRTWLHIHDVAHYYLGSKYFAELGYKRLYVAMLRAEAEVYDNHFRSLEARDLETNGLYDIRALLARSEPVKAAFTSERWRGFCADVAYFRDAMGRQYGEILRDHGFNPTPLWALVGGSLAQMVPAGSRAGILTLSLLDLGLQAALFAAVLWAFGLEAMLLAMIYFTVLFGASFGWTGGAFLRYLWLAGLIGGVCCLHKGRPALAGALLGWATVLRVFPAAFVAALGLKALRDALAERRLGRDSRRFFAAFLLTVALLFAATLLLPRGWSHWLEFRNNMQRHLQNLAYNSIGLTEILAYRGPDSPTTPATYDAAVELRAWLQRLQLVTAVPLGAAFVFWRSRRTDAVGAAALAPLLLFLGLDLAAYYFVLLLVPLLAFRSEPRRLVALFTAEAATYFLQLFEDRDSVLFLGRNVLVAFLLADLYLAPAAAGVVPMLSRVRGGRARSE
jgi:hypothetical protein